MNPSVSEGNRSILRIGGVRETPRGRAEASNGLGTIVEKPMKTPRVLVSLPIVKSNSIAYVFASQYIDKAT